MENVDINQKSIEETVSSDSSANIDSKVTTEGTVSTDTHEYTALVAQVEQTGKQLETLVNISIVNMVGLGIVVGVLLSVIFSRYFHD